MILSKHRSCFGCVFFTYTSLVSNCGWFAPPKQIPYEVLKKGCKYRMPKVESIEYHPTIDRIVELFHGELI